MEKKKVKKKAGKKKIDKLENLILLKRLESKFQKKRWKMWGKGNYMSFPMMKNLKMLLRLNRKREKRFELIVYFMIK